MTITVPNLQGIFEYPPKTLGWLIKHFWIAANVGNITPNFIIPQDTDTQDPWYDGVAPAIVFRRNGGIRGKVKATGDGVHRLELDMSIHIFSINQKQEWQFIEEIGRILKENRLSPIIKWSEYSPNTNPPNQQNNSGLKMFDPPTPTFRDAEDNQVVGDVSETHCLGVVMAIWYEIKT